MTVGLIARIEGRAGRITLDRPNALNTLTAEMVTEMDRLLRLWASDPRVHIVIVDGAGEKAFCAGGDVQQLFQLGRSGRAADVRDFFATEYRLNALIADYPKPYVAIMDGIVMGGGVGVSAHGSCRVGTERTKLAMPECAIGLIPDVGVTWLLGRMPGRAGEYVGLTGARLTAADAIFLRLADAFVPSAAIPRLITDLCELGTDAVHASYVTAPEPSRFAAMAGWIDATFGHASLVEILHALETDASPWSQEASASMRRSAPLSLHCALAAVRQARSLGTVDEALALEFRFTSRSTEHGDFLEGVRALLIDKDRAPRWRHGAVEVVQAAEVDAMLAPIPEERQLARRQVS